MSRKIFALVVSSTLAFGFAASTAQAQIKLAPLSVSPFEIAKFNRGVKLLNDGSYEEAAAIFEPICKKHPKYADAFTTYGAALIRLGRSSEAVATLEHAQELAPTDKLVLFNLGNAYMMIGQQTKALETFQKFVKLHPHGKHAQEAQARIDVLLTEQKRTNGIASSEGKDNYLDEAMTLGAARWDTAKMPISVFIASGTGLKGYKDNYVDILKEAFTDWSKATDDKLSFQFTTDENKAQITCTWTDKISDLVNPAEGGEALPSPKANGILYSAKIKILTNRVSGSRNAIKQVALHEIGHACGILGHSSQVSDIMLATLPENSDLVLSDRDKKTMTMLYDAPDSLLSEHPLQAAKMAYVGKDSNPTNRAIALNAQAYEAIQKEDYQKALLFLEQAASLAPDLEMITMNFAHVYLSLATEADRMDNQALAMNYGTLAIKYMAAGKNKDDAIKFCDYLIHGAQNLNKQDAVHELQELKTKILANKPLDLPVHTAPPTPSRPAVAPVTDDDSLPNEASNEEESPADKQAKSSQPINLDDLALEVRRASAGYSGVTDYFPTLSNEGVIRWPKTMLPLKVYIEPGADIRNYRDTFRQAIITSFNDWIKASGYRLSWKLVPKKEDANIVCVWVSKKDELPLHKHREQGVTDYGQTLVARTNEHWLQKVLITISTTHIQSGRALRNEDVYNVARHEVGHALGLTGHSTVKSDVMYPTMADKLTPISTRDAGTLNHLYAYYTTTPWD